MAVGGPDPRALLCVEVIDVYVPARERFDSIPEITGPLAEPKFAVGSPLEESGFER
jgi:hypothetical protein